MPQELFDADGNPVEVPTEDEIKLKVEEQAKSAVEEAVESAKTEMADEIQAAKDALSAKEEELKNVGNKDFNWKRINDAKESLEAKVKELEGSIDERISKARQEAFGDKVTNTIAAIAPDNTDLQAKIKFHYDNFKGEPKDDKEFKVRLNSALILATGGNVPKLTSEQFGTGGGSPLGLVSPNEGTTHKIAQSSVDVAKKMGITEEELKKRGAI